jgi:hypothetical protein
LLYATGGGAYGFGAVNTSIAGALINLSPRDRLGGWRRREVGGGAHVSDSLQTPRKPALPTKW